MKSADFTYNVLTGELRDREGLILTIGYSGWGSATNDPTQEHVRGRGPIPRGTYMIGPPRHSKNVGPVAMYLWPIGHDAHGRSALMIHGDNTTGTASKGCIVAGPGARKIIAEAAISQHLTTLEVV